MESSANLIHHAYHVSRFEDVTGARVADFDTIVEFGGGYGSMARLAWQLGFRGEYVIYDLPEMSAVQRYCLTSMGIPVSAAGTVHRGPGVSCATNADELARVLGDRVADLLLATWSLSETPVAFRERFLPLVRTNHYFFGYEDRYRGVDNDAYFTDLRARERAFRWDHQPSPSERRVSYLVGTRTAALHA